jgi:hypothetical protein
MRNVWRVATLAITPIRSRMSGTASVSRHARAIFRFFGGRGPRAVLHPLASRAPGRCRARGVGLGAGRRNGDTCSHTQPHRSPPAANAGRRPIDTDGPCTPVPQRRPRRFLRSRPRASDAAGEQRRPSIARQEKCISTQFVRAAYRQRETLAYQAGARSVQFTQADGASGAGGKCVTRVASRGRLALQRAFRRPTGRRFPWTLIASSRHVPDGPTEMPERRLSSPVQSARELSSARPSVTACAGT